MNPRSTSATILSLAPRLKSVVEDAASPFDLYRQQSERSSGPLRSVVLVRESEMSAGGASFVRFAKVFRPECVLDLRIAPRLDFIGGSRAHAFRLFRELDIEYVDVLGRLGIASKDDFSSIDEGKSTGLARWIESQFSGERPLVCVFDDSEVLSKCRSTFSTAISSFIFGRPNTSIAQYKAGLLAL